jgi:outer membrane protein
MKSTLSRWAPLGLAAIVMITVAATQQRPSAIALVNLQVIMEQTPGFQEARSQFQTEYEGYQAEMQQLGNQLDSLVRALEQQSVVLSPTAKAEKENEISAFQRRVQARAAELDDLTDQRQRELLAPLEQRVQAVIEGIRAERDLAVVFDIGSTSNIVSANQSLDITIQVVNRLKGGGS